MSGMDGQARIMQRDGRSITLSRRLTALARLVTPGKIVADVGCDHGFLSIYLVQSGRCPGALAMDVRKGPLSQAAEHIKDCGLQDVIETRLSDGLLSCHAGEAQTLVCAGMGGRLMQRILMQSAETVKQFDEMILQPQSELMQFRMFLREQGHRITEEHMVYEDGKYYFLMKVIPSGAEMFGAQEPEAGKSGAERQQLFDCYGELLIKRRDPVLLAYLEERRRVLLKICDTIALQGGAGAGERREQVEDELERVQEVLDGWESERQA